MTFPHCLSAQFQVLARSFTKLLDGPYIGPEDVCDPFTRAASPLARVCHACPCVACGERRLNAADGELTNARIAPCLHRTGRTLRTLLSCATTRPPPS